MNAQRFQFQIIYHQHLKIQYPGEGDVEQLGVVVVAVAVQMDVEDLVHAQSGVLKQVDRPPAKDGR